MCRSASSRWGSRRPGWRSSTRAGSAWVSAVRPGGSATSAAGRRSSRTTGRRSRRLHVGGDERGGLLGGELGDPVRDVLEHLQAVGRVDEGGGGLGGRAAEEGVAGAPHVQRRYPDRADPV